MPQKKKKSPQLQTPIGTLAYPWLDKPDTKFNQSKYKAVLLLDPTAPEVSSFLESLEELHEKGYQEALEETGKAKIKHASKPWKPEEDDKGNETGRIAVKLAVDSTWKDGSSRKPALFDSVGTPLEVPVYGGSEGRFKILVRTWNTALGYGLSLQPLACQVTKLVSKGQGNAASYGFDEIEDGYVFDPSEDTSGDTAEDADQPEASPQESQAQDASDF